MNRCSHTIGWADFTWNVVTGCRGPNGVPCGYCYARRIAERFKGSKAFPNGFAPTYHPERLAEPSRRKKPTRIFVGSMSDLFQEAVTPERLGYIFAIMAACTRHTFYVLTKQPQRAIFALDGLGPLPNVWIGATVDTDRRTYDSYYYMKRVRDAGWHTFASIEPMIDDVDAICTWWAEWVIIGAMSGPGAKKHKPRWEWIEAICRAADARHIPIFLKSSITALWPDLRRREWPEIEDRVKTDAA